MNYVTHAMGGAAAGMITVSAGNVTDPIQQTALMSGAVLGALFIDIDHNQSWAGHKFPVIAALTSTIFKHRGPVHTPVFVLCMGILVYAVNLAFLQEFWEFSNPFFLGFVPGMISHLLLDTLNVQGIMWLWPLSDKRISLLPIRTNSIFEGVVCLVLGAAIYAQINIF